MPRFPLADCGVQGLYHTLLCRGRISVEWGVCTNHSVFRDHLVPFCLYFFVLFLLGLSSKRETKNKMTFSKDMERKLLAGL